MSDLFTAEPLPAAAPITRATSERNRCAYCGRPFGLVRQRLRTRQLCSKACVDAESERMQRALKEKVMRLAGRG